MAVGSWNIWKWKSFFRRKVQQFQMFRANKPIRVNYCSTWFIKKVIFVQIEKNVQLLPPDGADADAEAQMKLSLSVESGAAICRSNLEPTLCLGTEISFFRILHFLSAAVGAKKLSGTPSRRIPNLSVLGSFFFFVGVGVGGVKKSLSVLAPIFFFLSRAFFWRAPSPSRRCRWFSRRRRNIKRSMEPRFAVEEITSFVRKKLGTRE